MKGEHERVEEGSKQAQAYQRIAPYYDALMRDWDYEALFERYRALLPSGSVPCRRILELGCGTGKMTERLVGLCQELVALDAAPAMLVEARKKRALCGEKVQWLEGRFEDFAIEGRFDLAFACFDVLNYVLDLAALSGGFACVARHLCAGGLFLFDVNSSLAFERALFDEDCYDAEGDVYHYWRGDYDAETRQICVDLAWHTPAASLRERHLQRAYLPEELKACLSRAGFVEIEVFDALKPGPLTAESDRHLYRARKGF